MFECIWLKEYPKPEKYPQSDRYSVFLQIGYVHFLIRGLKRRRLLVNVGIVID